MDELLNIFRALGDPSRLRILLLVRGMELAVGEIALILQQSQPRVSRHLRILAEARLTDRVREGAWVFVRLGPAAISAPVLALIDTLAVADDLGAAELGAADQARLVAVRADRAASVDAWFAAHAGEWEQERSLHIHEAGVEQAILAALDGPLGDLVDIGTGTGRMIELLGPRASTALGLDRSPEMLRLARNRLDAAGQASVRMQEGDMYDLPLAAAACDTVMLHQVLHFADDPAAVIAEAARVLRPGGRLAVVDLMPHGREDLRVERRHLRLGFGNENVLGWMADAGLHGEVAAQLHPQRADELGVAIWIGSKGAARQDQSPPLRDQLKVTSWP